MRKNLNLPPNIVDAISNFRHAGRYKSETAAVVDLLDRSTSDISHLNGYVYLATNSDESLFKIGFSANPKYRQKNLTCPKDGPAKILCFVRGGRVMEKSLHLLFNRHHHSGEWFQASKDIFDWFLGTEPDFDIDGLPSKKESRVEMSDEQYEFLSKAAAQAGMALATYLRHCALQAAKSEQG